MTAQANHPAEQRRLRPLQRAATVDRDDGQPRAAEGWRDLLPDVAAFVGALLCAVLAAVLAGALGGCGGGVGSEGTGGFASSGTFSSGPISGFGSIIVNGVHYDESTARVEDDDAQAQGSSVLALGMTVQVTAGPISTDAATGRQSATASLVRYSRALLGPVTALDVAAGTLTVLGQPVVVRPDTVIDAALGGTLAGASRGKVLEVYGSFDASTGRLVATRLAATGTAPASYAAVGTVTAVNPTDKTFVLNGQTCSSAGLADTSGLVVGAVLKVALQTTPDSKDRWVAGGQKTDTGSGSGTDRAGVKVSGRISSLPSATRLVVDGNTVDSSTASISGTLKLGAQVEVSGALRSGVLVATSIRVDSEEQDRSYELEGRPASIDTVAKRFVLKGYTVRYGGTGVVFKGGSAAQLAGYAGKLHVLAVLSADRSMLDATQVEFTD